MRKGGRAGGTVGGVSGITTAGRSQGTTRHGQDDVSIHEANSLKLIFKILAKIFLNKIVDFTICLWGREAPTHD